MAGFLDGFLTFTVLGLITAAAYAIASSGLVITYATSNVFNMAHGAIGMVSAFMFWQLTVPWGLPMVVSALLVVLAFALPAFEIAQGKINLSDEYSVTFLDRYGNEVGARGALPNRAR